MPLWCKEAVCFTYTAPQDVKFTNKNEQHWIRQRVPIRCQRGLTWLRPTPFPRPWNIKFVFVSFLFREEITFMSLTPTMRFFCHVFFHYIKLVHFEECPPEKGLNKRQHSIFTCNQVSSGLGNISSTWWKLSALVFKTDRGYLERT